MYSKNNSQSNSNYGIWFVIIALVSINIIAFGFLSYYLSYWFIVLVSIQFLYFSFFKRKSYYQNNALCSDIVDSGYSIDYAIHNFFQFMDEKTHLEKKEYLILGLVLDNSKQHGGYCGIDNTVGIPYLLLSEKTQKNIFVVMKENIPEEKKQFINDLFPHGPDLFDIDSKIPHLKLQSP